jgi:hypothetical protein
MSLANADGAIGAIGQAVSRTGSVWAAAQEREQEITERRVVTTAQMAMQNVKSEFDAWKEDPANARSPETWAPKAQEMVTSTMTPFLARKELGENAKADLALMGEAWGKGFVNQATLHGRKAGTAILTQDTLSLTEIDYGTGGWEEGDAKIDDLVKVGAMSEDVGKLKKHEGKGVAATYLVNSAKSRAAVKTQAGDLAGAKQEIDAIPSIPGYEQDIQDKKAEVNGDMTFVHEVNGEAKEINDAIAADPIAARESIADGTKWTKLRERDFAKLKDLDDKAKFEIHQRGETEANDAIVALTKLPPDKVKEADFNTLVPGAKYASEGQRQRVEITLAKAQNLVGMNDPVRFREMTAVVQQITPSTSMIDIHNLEQTLDKTFNERMRDTLRDQIEMRVSGKVPEGFENSSVIASVEQLKADGAFGIFEIEKTENGNRLMKESPKSFTESKTATTWYNLGAWWKGEAEVVEITENPSTYVPVKIVDLAAKGQADQRADKAIQLVVEDQFAGKINSQADMDASFMRAILKAGVRRAPDSKITMPLFSVKGPETPIIRSPSGNELPEGGGVGSANPLIDLYDDLNKLK